MDQSRYPLVRRWTSEEHERLLAMAAAGSRPDEIARALGRTEPAVRVRAHNHTVAVSHAEARQLRRPLGAASQSQVGSPATGNRERGRQLRRSEGGLTCVTSSCYRQPRLLSRDALRSRSVE